VAGRLDPRISALAHDANHAVLTTLLPSGQPMTQLMWIDAEGDSLIINSESHRQKVRNVKRDPRVTVTILDWTNPHRYAEVRGVVTDVIAGDRARLHADTMSLKYHGVPYSFPIQSERVLLVIEPHRQRYFDVPRGPRQPIDDER
jgi:PPOX class probable F420-dependent enzyme